MKTKSILPFAKISGAGNDFIVFDGRSDDFERDWTSVTGSKDRPSAVRLLCRREQSIGADGVVIIKLDPVSDFSWEFYNDDGSTAEMCGNAARCVARFAHETKIAKSPMRFTTAAGVVAAEVLEKGDVKVTLGAPRLIDTSSPHLIDSGVPHTVIETDSLDKKADLLKIVSEYRYSTRPGPKGSNVTFYKKLAPQKLQTVSFERGVERFTLACGTGAIATAFSENLKTGGDQFEVVMPGGTLSVVFNRLPDMVDLIGPTRFVYEGKLTEEALYESV